MHPPKTEIPPTPSLTHQHIVAVVNTLMGEAPHSGRVNILDVGCANGRLIDAMMKALPALRPDVSFHLYGFDLPQWGIHPQGYMAETERYLTEQHPGVNWGDRLRLITATDPWPYEDGTFHFIISNQVMEHVEDLNFVFGEIRRCLAPGGIGVHLFAVREVLWEGHARVPLAHHVKDLRRRERLLLFFARLGFRSTYRREMPLRGWNSPEEFASIYARVIESDTRYRTVRQLKSIAREAGLQASFAYTQDYFRAKFLSLLGKRSFFYPDRRVLNAAFFPLAKRIASITLLLKKGR